MSIVKLSFQPSYRGPPTLIMCVEPDLQLALENNVMLARTAVSADDEFVPVRLIIVTNGPVTL